MSVLLAMKKANITRGRVANYMLDDIKDKFTEHIDYLDQTNDAIQSAIDKIKSLFTGEGLSKIGGFLNK